MKKGWIVTKDYIENYQGDDKPVDHYGSPNAGAVHIQYLDNKKNWNTL